MNKWLINILFSLMILSLSACSGVNFSQWHFPYMMTVQQGNYISNSQVNQLKIGQTKDQVAYIIGQPLTQFMFNNNHWDFIFQEYANNKLSKSYNLTITFNNESQVIDIQKAGQFFTN